MRRPVAREWVLLAASLLFYSWWDVRFLPILLAQSTATWGAVALYRRSGRAGWLWAGVAVNFASLIETLPGWLPRPPCGSLTYFS